MRPDQTMTVQKLTDSTVAARPSPTSEPAQMPIAIRAHSRRHSGQLVMGRLVERIAASRPTKYHITPLVRSASIHRVVPPITGTPNSVSVGTAAMANTKPGMPRTAEFDPTSNRAATAPMPVAMPMARSGPHARTIER